MPIYEPVTAPRPITRSSSDSVIIRGDLETPLSRLSAFEKRFFELAQVLDFLEGDIKRTNETAEDTSRISLNLSHRFTPLEEKVVKALGPIRTVPNQDPDYTPKGQRYAPRPKGAYPKGDWLNERPN